jgi:hypothetical protein
MIRDAAARAGCSIDDDHYGAVVFAAQREHDAGTLRTIFGRTRPGLTFEHTIAVGPLGVRSLLDRFRAVGATEFVLQPVASDPAAFLRDLKIEVVDPIEANS